MRQMGYNSQVLGKRSQGVLNPIVFEHRINHKDPIVYGQEETSKRSFQAKINFVKVRGIEE
jgi:hypothetical protein